MEAIENSTSIPEIDVSAVDVKCDSDDEEAMLLSLTDVLTDTEIVNDDTSTSQVTVRKSKLMVKLVLDDYATDMEDIQTSDADEDDNVALHQECVVAADCHLQDDAIIEMHTSNALKRNQRDTHIEFIDKKERRLLNPTSDVIRGQLLTDVEDFDTDNEVEVDDSPITNINYDDYLQNDINVLTCSGDASNIIESKKRTTKCSSASNRAQQDSNDSSDSEQYHNQQFANVKMKRRKPRTQTLKHHDTAKLQDPNCNLLQPQSRLSTSSKLDDEAITDCEDIDLDNCTLTSSVPNKEQKCDDLDEEFMLPVPAASLVLMHGNSSVEILPLNNNESVWDDNSYGTEITQKSSKRSAASTTHLMVVGTDDEPITDTEDILIGNTERNYQNETCNELEVSRTAAPLTDVEDICASDY